MEGGKMETGADSGGNQLADDETTGCFLFPAGFGSVAVEFLKGPCKQNKRKLIRGRLFYSAKKQTPDH